MTDIRQRQSDRDRERREAERENERGITIWVLMNTSQLNILNEPIIVCRLSSLFFIPELFFWECFRPLHLLYSVVLGMF